MTAEKLERANEIASELDYLKNGGVFSLTLKLGVYGGSEFENHPEIVAKKEEIRNIVARLVYEKREALEKEFESL